MDFLSRLFGRKKTGNPSPFILFRFPFVYVNQDGSVREVSPDEREYLTQEFQGGDGGRPYVKTDYTSTDGWGSQSGFLERRRVPKHIQVAPVNPDFDAAVRALDENLADEMLEAQRAAGDIITVNPDGSVLSTPHPDVSPERRFEIIKAHRLEQQRRREALAKF